MGTSLDALNAPSSLTQRRQAASNLPNFELPPPSNLQFAQQKFPPLSGVASQHHTAAAISLGNLLTPPSNSASEGSAHSSGIPTGATPNGSGLPVLPYTPTFFNTGYTPTFHTGHTPQPWQGSNPLFPPRSMFSPGSAGPLMRHSTHSPTAAEGSSLPPPPYDLNNVPSYGGSMSLASSANSASISAQQQQQQQQHQAMANSMMHNGVRPPSQQSPISPNDSVSKPSSTPALFSSMPSSASSQHSGYPYSSSTPVSQSPHISSAPPSRVSPPLHQTPVPSSHQQQHQHQHQHQPHHPFIRPPYPSYTLPAMPGPAMSNISSPGASMSMVGNVPGGMLPMGFNSGYVANPQAMYGQQRTGSPQQPANNDRPFKCDQCPQSFNRNHDLKRHKRIHLAVKPFPCNHCDKSFSRKDALKRHILVKGCGNRGSAEGAGKEDGVKSESGSDIVSDSPVVPVAA